ncbi:flagellar biosynthesis protein FliR [Vibrio astriarenae]|nr:flagellar biosynthesis protein FliR [Vibrio sp. C7]
MVVTMMEISQWLGWLWWPFVRLSGFALVSPFFGDRAIPVKVRLIFVVLFTLLLAPMLPTPQPFDPFSMSTALQTVYQLIFGFLIGFSVMIFFTIFSIAGQAISMQMGLAMAVMNDPANGVSIAIIGRIMFITGMLLFLSLDGHLVILVILRDSFVYWPLHQAFPFDGIEHVLKMVSWMFSTSLLVAIPAIVIMLLSNITFGLMNKAAPALNVFALGFPMTMLLGLLALFASISGIGEEYFSLFMTLKAHLYYLLRIPNV